MKNIILTLASVAVLAWTAHAQSLASFIVDSAFTAGDSTATWNVSSPDGHTGVLNAMTTHTGGFDVAKGNHAVTLGFRENQAGVVSFSYSGDRIDDSITLTLATLNLGNITTVSGESSVLDNSIGFTDNANGNILALGDSLDGIALAPPASGGSMTTSWQSFDNSVSFSGGSSGGGFLYIDFNFAPTPAPEASSTALLGLGALGLLARRKR